MLFMSIRTKRILIISGMRDTHETLMRDTHGMELSICLLPDRQLCDAGLVWDMQKKVSAMRSKANPPFATKAKT
jgi:hypothetical protein